MTQPTNTVDNTGASVPSTSGLTNPSTQMDENSFLKLLVAQLKYQDPMSPTDNQQFMQEQAQFSTVEGINNLQSTMKSMQSQQQVSQSVALIGKQVSYVGGDGTVGSGVVSSVTSSGDSLSVNVGGKDIDPSTIVTVADAPKDAGSDEDTAAALAELATLLQSEMPGATDGSTGGSDDGSTDGTDVTGAAAGG